jgi:hypothetical protein
MIGFLALKRNETAFSSPRRVYESTRVARTLVQLWGNIFSIWGVTGTKMAAHTLQCGSHPLLRPRAGLWEWLGPPDTIARKKRAVIS